MKRIAKYMIELAEALVIALVAVMVLFSLFCRIYEVDGHSMDTTLAHGDRLLVSQLFYTPEQGDIVCFVAKNNDDKVLVKRVIATEGQTIDINEEKKVTIDGEVLEEPYLDEWIYTDEKGFPFPYEVQEGEVFCLGDNRVNSKDSRDLGPIETKHLLGRMIIRVWPETGVVK